MGDVGAVATVVNTALTLGHDAKERARHAEAQRRFEQWQNDYRAAVAAGNAARISELLAARRTEFGVRLPNVAVEVSDGDRPGVHSGFARSEIADEGGASA